LDGVGCTFSHRSPPKEDIADLLKNLPLVDDFLEPAMLVARALEDLPGFWVFPHGDKHVEAFFSEKRLFAQPVE